MTIPLTKNGKLYVAPPECELDFKELFQILATAGAGRPLKSDGFPPGGWTPELLATAISELNDNEDGVELRTVQRWFQSNDQGIGYDNISRLARIVGCDDPHATAQWQAKINASNVRLSAKRRAKKRAVPNQDKPLPDLDPDQIEATARAQFSSTRTDTQPGSTFWDDTQITIHRGRPFSVALKAEAMFAGANSIGLPIAVWCGMGILWFMAYIFGAHDISYPLANGVQKEVGFFWSSAWSIGDLILLPMFLIVVTELINRWKGGDRSTLSPTTPDGSSAQAWALKVQRYSGSFWAVLFVCVSIIFLIQWIGVYLSPLLSNKTDVAMIDWMLAALVRPDVITTEQAVILSFLAFAFSGMIYWFFFSGLLFLYIIASDFSELCAARRAKPDDMEDDQFLQIAVRTTSSIFHCCVLGCLIATTIKLNAAYLVSDAATLTSWLSGDGLAALRLAEDGWGWAKGSPSPFFTSLLLLFLVCFIFAACLVKIVSAADQLDVPPDAMRAAQRIWIKMAVIMALLAVSFILIGQFVGFSLLLLLSVSVGINSLFWRPANDMSEPVTSPG